MNEETGSSRFSEYDDSLKWVPEFRKTERSKFRISNRVGAKQYSDEGAELVIP